MAKWSTYARLLKPGQIWYTKDNYVTYTTERVNIIRVRDVVMVRVYVEGRKNPFIFDENDRVELTDR
jgi:hypothetical protein